MFIEFVNDNLISLQNFRLKLYNRTELLECNNCAYLKKNARKKEGMKSKCDAKIDRENWVTASN